MMEETRWCKLCERFVPLTDNLKIVIEPRHGHSLSGKGAMLVLDKKLGVMHSLVSAAQTKRILVKVGKIKGEVVTVRNPNQENAPVPSPQAPVEVFETESHAPEEPPVSVPAPAEELVLSADDWYNALVVRVNPKGFLTGVLDGANDGVAVYIYQNLITRASGRRVDDDTDIRPGMWLAVRVTASSREDSSFKWEAVEAVIEDISEEEQQS
jgi:hypothetical protein